MSRAQDKAAVTFTPITLDATDIVNTAEIGDLVAVLQWDGIGCPTVNDPTGHLYNDPCMEDVRLAKSLTDLPVNQPLVFSLTESAPVVGSMGPVDGFVPVTTPASLMIDAPPPGDQYNVAQLVVNPTPDMTEDFSDPNFVKNALYSPRLNLDGSVNPNANLKAKWRDFNSEEGVASDRLPTEAYLSAGFYDNSSNDGRRNIGPNHESQLYANPLANGLPSPFRMKKGGGIQIVAQAITPSSTWAQYYNAMSGQLQLVQTLPANNCTRLRAKISFTPGIFPTIGWQWSRGGNTAEKDWESAWDAAFSYVTFYKHQTYYQDAQGVNQVLMADLANQNAGQKTYSTPLSYQAYHTWVSCQNNSQVIDLYDGVSVSAINTPVEYKVPWAFMMDLAVTSPGGPAPAFLSVPGGNGTLTIDKASWWTAKDDPGFRVGRGVPGYPNQYVSTPVATSDGSGFTNTYVPNYSAEPPTGMVTVATPQDGSAPIISAVQPLSGTAAWSGLTPGTAYALSFYQVNLNAEGQVQHGPPYNHGTFTTSGTAPPSALQAVTGMAAYSNAPNSVHFAFNAVAGGQVPDHYIVAFGFTNEAAGDNPAASSGPYRTGVPASYGSTGYGSTGQKIRVRGYACSAQQTTTTSSNPATVYADIAAHCGPESRVDLVVQ